MDFDLDDILSSSETEDDVWNNYISDSEIELGDYDEDGCYNIDAYNSLLEEYLNKSKQLFTNMFKSEIRRVYTKDKKLDKLKGRLWERKIKLMKMKQEIDTKVDKLESRKEDVAMEYLKSLGLVKFKPGQKVYVVKSTRSTSVQCKTCDGKRKLFKTIDGIKYETECPECKGRGSFTEWEYTIEEGYVQSVYFRLYASMENSPYNDKHTTKLRLQDYSWDNDTIYVNFGGCNTDTYHLSDLYETKEEAEKHIEELKQRQKKEYKFN